MLSAGPIPLYHQLAQDLRRRILTGELPVGEPLPTEQKLCHQYGVSRITVRRGLDDLINAGLIERRRGVGTFVADKNTITRSTSLVGSLYEALAYPSNIEIEVLHRDTIRASTRIATSLKLAAGSHVTRLQVISRVEGDPFAATTFYFPATIGEHIATGDLHAGTPVAHLVERHLDEPIVRAAQMVEPEQANTRTARALGIPAKSAILHIWRTYYTAAGQPVEQVSVHYHPDRYRLQVELLANAVKAC